MGNIEIHRSKEEAVDQLPATGCACGETDEGLPELDVQTIPHAIRHAAIFGAVDGLPRGGGLILSATHDPIPLLAQLEARYGEEYRAAYLGHRGPERWRVLIRRAA